MYAAQNNRTSERGHDLVLLEIKAGQTVSRNYFQGLERFADVVGERVKGGIVVYGGEKSQCRSSWEVWPIGDIGELRNRVERFLVH